MLSIFQKVGMCCDELSTVVGNSASSSLCSTQYVTSENYSSCIATIVTHVETC